jgi:cytidylate kinase
LFIVSSKGFRHGVGRSTVALFLAETLENTVHLSQGSLFRDMGEEHGMNVAEFDHYAETHPEIDKKVDEKMLEKTLEALKNQENVVVEGNLMACFAHGDVNILVDASDEVRGKRVYKKHRKGDRKYEDAQDALEELKRREESDRKRYEKLYGITPQDHQKKFHFVVDNTDGLEKTFEQLIKKIHDKLVKR